MKIGDLVQWNDRNDVNDTPYLGIVTDGPRDGCQGTEKVRSYEIAWFQADLQRAWHTSYNLELLSVLRGNEV